MNKITVDKALIEQAIDYSKKGRQIMDILERIDFVQQFAKEYADGSWSIEVDKWKHHVTPEFIEDIRQYIVSLQLKLMHQQTAQNKEAVAWRVWNGGLQDDGNVYVYSEDGDGEPLYTSPPPPAEMPLLTDDEINDIYDEVAHHEPYSGAVTRRNAARAIEQAAHQKAGLK